MRHLFVVDSLDVRIQNEKELIHPVSAGGRGLFCICVESTNLNLNLITGRSSPKPKRGVNLVAG